MYTATKLGDTVDKQSRRRIVTVNFSDGVSEFPKDFMFAIETSVDLIKGAVKQYLDEINVVVPALTGEIAVASAWQTPAEIAQGEWIKDYHKLQQVQKLIDLGVLTGNEAPIVALKTKVKSDFKVAYLNVI